MFEALIESLRLFGVIEAQEIGEDYSRTKERVFCHVTEAKRYLALREQFALPVSYLPHPFLFAESSIRKASPPLCLVLRKRNEPEPKHITRAARAQGYRVATIDDAQLGLREKRRAYKEAAVVIACSFSSEWSEVLLCAAKTPFLAAHLTSKIALDYLRLSGVTEKVLDFSTEGLRSLVTNHDLFRANATYSLTQLRNLLSWKVHTPTTYTKNGYALVTLPLEGRVVLTPWVALLSDESHLEREELQVSRLFCAGIVVRQQLSRSDWPFKVVPEPDAIFKNWTGQILMICADGTCVRYNLQTKRGTRSELSLEPNEILVLEVFNWELIKQAVILGMPFLSAPTDSLPDFLDGYEGIQEVNFLPREIEMLLTPQFVAYIATQIFAIRNTLLAREIDV